MSLDFKEINIEKKFYGISEISEKTNVNAYTLRYWEKNGLIYPIKIHNGQRRYTLEHINLILKLKNLIFEKKLGIKATKLYLKKDTYTDTSILANELKKNFTEIKKELKAILKLI